MARKIFISYKYSDPSVQYLPRYNENGTTTVRHYVDMLQDHIDAGDNINKGENDGEDMSEFKDETIESKLRDKIFDSSVTVVVISKNMKDQNLSEDEQWIPWEISYSLKKITRNEKTSDTNAMLAVVIPDENGDYSYMVNHYSCVTQWNTASLFKILNENMFNRNEKKLINCSICGDNHHTDDDHSYIYPVKWEDFISDMNYYLDHVVEINKNIDLYNLFKITS